MPRAITKDLYGDMLSYFREHPGDSSGCAKACGVHYKTARRMWKGPRNKIWPWADPIEELLIHEKEQELTEEEKREEERRLGMAQEAERARKIEEQALRFEEQALGASRATIVMGLSSLAQLTQGINKLAKEVNEQLLAGVDQAGKPLKMDVGKCLNLIRSYTVSVKGLTQATEALVQLGRLQRELPTTIMGLDIASMSLEDARREVEFANRALHRAEGLGLKVLEGGGRSLDD